MKMVHSTVAVCGLILASLAGHSAWADVLNMPTGQKSLDFVTVGDPRNQADSLLMSDGTRGYGSVAYTYKMGEYKVTAAQYSQFLSAVGATDKYELYNWRMGSIAHDIGCGIIRNGDPGNYTYSVVPGRENFPVNFVDWGTAARFCNWLTNGQPTGTLTGNPTQDAWLTEDGSYALNGTIGDAGFMSTVRKPGAKYVLPSEDEWYKAAYYKGGSTNAGYWLYPTKSDVAPSNLLDPVGTNNANCWIDGFSTDDVNHLTAVGVFAGSPGPYGTLDMGGNVFEWNESVTIGPYNVPGRALRGGWFGSFPEELAASFRLPNQVPTRISLGIGFRVAVVPEPATLSLLALGGLLIARRRV